MDQQSNSEPYSGFSNHVSQQLQQAAQQVSTADSHQANRTQDSGRGRSQQRRVTAERYRGSRSSHQPSYVSTGQPAMYPSSTAAPMQGYPQQTMHPQAPSNLDDFPPLGASDYATRQTHPTSRAPPTSHPKHAAEPAEQLRAQSFFHQPGMTGRRAHPEPYQMRHSRGREQTYLPAQHANYRNRAPPPVPMGQPHNPTAAPRTMYERPDHAYRKMMLLQSDYLNSVATDTLRHYYFTVEEENEKESYRTHLEKIAQDSIADFLSPNLRFDPKGVKLRCYGSLANGFAMPGCDIDLVLTLPESQTSLQEVEDAAGRVLEKALLNRGFGARLLTNTRVPILRVCQNPGAELLSNLRKNREMWEEEQALATKTGSTDDKSSDPDLPLDITSEQSEIAHTVFRELDNTAVETPLPSTPTREHGHLEFQGDCGIQCDINFSNQVALYNTRLLRTYCEFDTRVRQLGLMVKAWAKARKINTTYHGTLSSYGYILMVLHYLMNIANPPVIPNLQYLAYDEDAWKNNMNIELFQGFDVRFLQDKHKIEQAREGMRRNNESVGSLLRGFFYYFGQNNGFRWTTDVISLRTKGGMLKKHAKGWTSAKWADGPTHTRLRYLLCIEDPFEIEHNIARTVGHHGIVAIRDEFRRAVRILETVKRTEIGWQWRNENEISDEPLMKELQHRGDLLKQDQLRIKQLKQQELEAKTKSLTVEDDGAKQGNSMDQNGMFQESLSTSPYQGDGLSRPGCPTNNKLTTTVGSQGDHPRSKRKIRRLKEESDDEGDAQRLGANDEPQREDEKSTEGKSRQDDMSHQAIAEDLSNAIRSLDNSAASYDSHGLGALPRPESWDLSTREGRWLERRDNKIRNGTWKRPLAQRAIELDQRFPFNPLRLASDPTLGVWEHLEIYPPWPMHKNQSYHNTPVNAEVIQPDGDSEKLSERAWPTRNSKPTWDARTEGGKWLIWRDRKIERGWKPTKLSMNFRELSQAFPYNPYMTAEELEAKNTLLRQQYRNRTRVTPEEYEKILQACAQIENPEASGPSTQHSSTVDLSLDEATGTDGECSDELRSTVPSNDGLEPDYNFIRAQRLAFFDSNLTRKKNDSTVSQSSNEVNNVEVMMRDAGIGTNDRGQTRKDSGIAGISHLQRSLLSSSTGNNSPADASSELTPDRSESSGRQVPLTLCPSDTPSAERPREENPNIIPIPRKLGFQFDPRQLSDLAVIEAGGNGCVRKGNEYDFEEEYEWGGGGAMGDRIWGSSSGQPNGNTGGTQEWVAGRGDDEGFLQELPGFV